MCAQECRVEIDSRDDKIEFDVVAHSAREI